MKTIFVSPHDACADTRSLSDALQQAQPSDVVLVGPGHYSPSLNRGTLPGYLFRLASVSKALIERSALLTEKGTSPLPFILSGQISRLSSSKMGQVSAE